MIASAARRVPIASLTLLALAHCIFRAPSSTTPRARADREGPPRWLALRDRADAAPRDASVATDVAGFGRCPDEAVYVPGGTFTMGSADPRSAPDERPAHEVSLSDYCIDRVEVTAAAYTRCVTARACTRPASQNPVDDGPVTGIDWNQAEAYCRSVGGRLPTEAEWEFAARGTDGREYPWGAEAPSDCERADWSTGGASCRGVGPSPVGSFPRGASPFGALDMAGNVWEWTADWYARSYSAGSANDPTGPEQGSARVTRGGGWNNDQPDRLRATFREGQHPSFHDYDLGVRCAYDPTR